MPCARALAPGGSILIETLNPENLLVGSHTFYHDFSHRNPVTPTSRASCWRSTVWEQMQVLAVETRIRARPRYRGTTRSPSASMDICAARRITR
ncbi:hypothetical protein ACU4GD_14795 [Cupriavidus basilensis]